MVEMSTYSVSFLQRLGHDIFVINDQTVESQKSRNTLLKECV